MAYVLLTHYWSFIEYQVLSVLSVPLAVLNEVDAWTVQLSSIERTYHTVLVLLSGVQSKHKQTTPYPAPLRCQRLPMLMSLTVC